MKQTTAIISIMHPDDTLTSIRVLRDGQPEFAEEILSKHYPSPEKIKALLEKGDLIDLESSVDRCLYCCDDIEDWGDTAPMQHPSLAHLLAKYAARVDYIYIYTRGKWYCHEG